jgi:hypothetical protein
VSQPDKRQKLKSIVTERWLTHMGIVIMFSCAIVLSGTTDDALKTAMKRGILALIIAILGEVGLTVAPFWVIFSVSYYMESWI